MICGSVQNSRPFYMNIGPKNKVYANGHFDIRCKNQLFIFSGFIFFCLVGGQFTKEFSFTYIIAYKIICTSDLRRWKLCMRQCS